MQRRIASVSLVAAAALAASLVGCSQGSGGGGAASFGDCDITGEAGSITLETMQEGVLTLGTNLPSPAWWQGTSPESIDGGFEYCLGAELAHRAGIDRVVVKNVSWDGLIAGQDDDFDIAMAQVSITPERSEAVNFSSPYYSSMVGVLTAADSGVTAANIKDKQLGYQVGTTSEAVINMIKPGSEPRVFQDVESLVAAVQAGQIDAALQDSAIMIGFAKNSDGALTLVGQYDTNEVYGAIIPSSSPNADAFNKAIETLGSDGTLDKLSEKWLAPEFGGSLTDITMFN